MLNGLEENSPVWYDRTISEEIAEFYGIDELGDAKMPISRVYLKELCDASATFMKGVSYFFENRVWITEETVCLDRVRQVFAKVRGNGQKYTTGIAISPDTEKLNGYQCDCPAFSSYSGVCKHIVALALAVNAMDESERPQKQLSDKTDPAALQVLRQYARKSLEDAMSPLQEKSGAVLVPTLEVQGTDALASFTLGVERQYVIKNLLDFVNAIKNVETTVYGKRFTFTHSLASFAEESVEMARFLRTYYNRQNELFATGYIYRQEKNRRMVLSGFLLDEFMKLLEGKNLAVETGKKTANYAVRFENPSLRLHVDQQNDGYIIRFAKSWKVLFGAARLYLLADGIVYGCDPVFSEAVMDFFKSIASVPKQCLYLSKTDMPAFAATLLPALEPHMKIVSDYDLSEFRPPALESRVYLDLPEPDCVTARVEFHYGAKFHMGFKNKDIHESYDLKAERKVENLLSRYFGEMSPEGQLFLNDEEKLFSFLDHGVEEISELAEVFASDAFQTLKIKPPAAVSVGVRVDAGLLRLFFDVQGLDIAELEDVLQSYRRAKKYHRLRDGSVLSLDGSSLSELSELVQGLDLTSREFKSGEISLPKYRALYLDTLLRQSEQIRYDRDGAFKQMIRDLRDVSDADFPIPKSLKNVLRNYQKTGYRWMRSIAAYGFGGILADDMGLGKTLQVIALLLAQNEEQLPDAPRKISLVACPSSLVLNWSSEMQKFAPALKAVVVTGTAARREELIKAAGGEADLLITSYDSLKRDIEWYAGFFFQYVIADEAQYMKNHNTQNAKTVKALNASVRFALTGTPVENSLAEVWSIFDFLMPGYLYHYAKFRKEFETPIVRQKEDGAAKRLRQMVSPFILRRMKKEVLKELPPKIETVRFAELEGEQEKLYTANAAAAVKELESGLGDSGSDKLQILAMITKLRQICCDPALVYENYADDSAKLELCMELLQECMESGHRVLLFSQFTTMLHRIAERLDHAGIAYYTITGETKVSQRLDLVNGFNADDTPVFLISLKAGGTGLNLTGADVVIHYDPWWNVSAQNQASDRAHRIGQLRTVQVYKLIAKNTIEERILEMQKSKSDLADLVVKEGDGAFASMSKTEILALFQ